MPTSTTSPCAIPSLSREQRRRWTSSPAAGWHSASARAGCGPSVVEHHGEFFDFGPTAFEPKPVQRPGPALHVGGEGSGIASGRHRRHRWDADEPQARGLARCADSPTRSSARSGRQATPYFGYVAVELYFERFEVRELGLGPDAFDESQASLLTIEVAVEVEEMSLDE